MCCSPFHHPESGRGRDLVGAARVCKGRAFRPVGLTAREEGLSPTDRAGKLSNARCGLVGPYERAVSCSKEELGIDERTEERVARRPIQTPQPLGLRGGQSQAGHFNVFPLNASNHLIERLLLGCHVVPCVLLSL